jgi:DNA-binding protein YbaB
MADLDGLDELLAHAGRMSEQLSEVEFAVGRASSAIEAVLGRLGVSSLIDDPDSDNEGKKVSEIVGRLQWDGRKPVVGSDEAGGVRVEIQGSSGEVGVRIDRELLASGDPERIERSIAEAMSAALRQSREKMLDLFSDVETGDGIFSGISDALRASLGAAGPVKKAQPEGDVRVKGRGLEPDAFRGGRGQRGIGSHAEKLAKDGSDGDAWLG